MPRIARSRVATRLLVASVVGLFGCPQLLEDRFGTLNTDAGGLCPGFDCGLPRSGDSAGSAGIAGALGTGGTPASDAGSAGTSGAGSQASEGGASGRGGTASSGGSAGASGSAGTTGTAGSAGSTGSSGAAGTSGGAGTSGVGNSCWILDLTSATQDDSSNCIGIDGWNAAVFEAPSSLTASYQNGDVCLHGSIATSGWGAVYNLTFNGDEDGSWDATTSGVTGFEFTASGSDLPASLHLKYSVGRDDYCRVIVPSGVLGVPFSSTHPDCSTDATSGTPDPRQLSVLRVVFPVLSSTYNVDFCLHIRALP